MSADLDTLNDAQLSEVFAVEYLGWAIHSRNTACWVDSAERDGMTERAHAFVGELNFATSADAVLPILERTQFRIERLRLPAAYCVYIYTEHADGGSTYWKAEADTLARAACLALLKDARAKRAENGGAK